jgi:hypothetical protein
MDFDSIHQSNGGEHSPARQLTLCSNDPICAEHSDGSEEYPLQGAACHACLLVPETSREARNTQLDRGLLTQRILGGGFPLMG